MVSCSTNYTISQLMKLNDIDFDKIEGSKRYVPLNFDDAQAWAEKEIENEYIVLMDFDKNTGERICKSIPKKRVSLPAENKTINLLDENGEFLLEDED